MYRKSKAKKSDVTCLLKKKLIDQNADKEKQNSSFLKIFGFDINDLSGWRNFVQLLYRPTDPASLGVVRALFGLLMILDIPEERGLSRVDIRWGDPLECQFSLLNFLQPLPLQWMCIVYLIMWIGAVGIMLGLFFKASCLAFAATYWYIFLLDKSSWNNHSYLYGLFSLLLIPSQANQYFSLDALFWPRKRKTAPLWNYAILRYQLFILYFIAGLKKLDLDWLSGYSMTNLSNHWVFQPFRLILSTEQIDFWIVHLGGFFLDLTIAFWLFFDFTRIPAMLFCGSFHIMNSQLFSIGMFPYVCLATMPLFCSPSWPRSLIGAISSSSNKNYKAGLTSLKQSHNNEGAGIQIEAITWRHYIVVSLLATHVGIQGFLPYSHFITKGYNNWTNGLYGYSWDMMVHTWNTILVMPRIVENTSGKELFLDPDAWVQNDRWSKHTDMVIQWAQCMKHNLKETQNMDDITVHLDVWSSLNGRFQQRMYDPRVDLLTAKWSPFERPSWVMPLMTELSTWRDTMTKIEQHVFSWSNYSDVLFVADFSGLTLENYIVSGLGNVTLTVLSGDVILEQGKPGSQKKMGDEISLTTGESSPVLAQAFHLVHTVSKEPACYMYTFTNETALQHRDPPDTPMSGVSSPSLMQIIDDSASNFVTALSLVWNALLHVVFNVPVPRRVKVG